MSIEDDVTKINEVTARLAGPMKVWVLVNDTETATVITKVFASQDMAREYWGQEVLRDCQRFGLAEDKIDALLDQCLDPTVFAVDVLEREWYSLQEVEVIV